MYNNKERNQTDHVYGKRYGETYHDASMRQSYGREMQLQQQEQYDKMNAQANAYNTMPHSGGIGSNDLGVMPVTKFGKLLG